MNREILFRGKRIDNGEWVYGYLFSLVIYDRERFFIIPCGTYCPKDITIKEIQVEVTSETVGQFTGLTDKNGTKIFDGDLLHRHMNIHWVVTFKQSTWIADSPTENSGLYLSSYQFNETTITGTIHDNPTT